MKTQLSIFFAVFLVSLSPVSADPGSIYASDQKGIVAYWSFESLSNNTLLDMTGNGFNASLSGGEYVRIISDGVSGNALECRGQANDSMLGMYDIEVKNSYPYFNLPVFSVEAWAYSYVNMYNPGSFFNQRAIFENLDAAPGGIANGYSLKVLADGKPVFSWGSATNGPWDQICYDSIMRPNRWYHFVATWDTTDIVFYVNGKMVGKKRYDQQYKLPIHSARIGCQWLMNQSDTSEGITRQFFNGKIDELKLYNFALDSITVKAHYLELKPTEDKPFEINLGMKTTYASAGDTVVMPVYYSNYEAYLMSAIQLSILYNPDQLTLLTISNDSGLVNNWELFDWTNLNPGVIKIGMGGISKSLAYGEGELFRCVFKVNPAIASTDTCKISLTDIDIDEAKGLIISSSQDGRIIITKKAILYGDVTGNGEISILDAQKVLSYIVGSLTLPDSSCPNFTTEVADVSGNGKITSYDASLILQYSLGLITYFPVEYAQSMFLSKRIASTAVPAVFTIRQSGTTAEGVNYELTGKKLRGFRAAEFAIKCNDASVLFSQSIIRTSIPGARLFKQFNNVGNYLKLAVISNDDIDHDEEISVVTITLPVSSAVSSSAFTIEAALINEGKIISNYISKGLTEIDVSDVVSNRVISGTFHVNLLNKGLKIVSTGSEPVKISLWNLNGKLIRQNPVPVSQEFIALNDLPRGAYIYQVSCGASLKTGRIMIAR